MNTQLEKIYRTYPNLKEENGKLSSRFQFCGHEMWITRDFSKNIGVAMLIWEPCRVLCRYFEEEKIIFTGKKVIELGAGTGMVGILAILLGGDVTLTDQPKVLSQIEYNVTSNIPSAKLQFAKVSALSWGRDHGQFPSDYDYILGSDIIYKSHEFDLLINTLLHLSNRNTIIYLASKMRPSMRTMDFHEKLIPLYFNSEIVYRIAEKEINVYKITKK